MESITRSLANEYIRAAQRDLAKGRSSEYLAVEHAAELNRVGMEHPTFDIAASAEETPGEPEVLEVLTWQTLILKEVCAAICNRDKKYRREVAALKENGRLLIGAIAGYVAASLGVLTAVIAALVAAILRLVVVMGISVFCKKFGSLFSK